VNCKERGGKEGGGKLVLPGGTPVLWMYRQVLTIQYNIFKSSRRKSKSYKSSKGESNKSCRGMGETAANNLARAYCKMSEGRGVERYPEFCVNQAIDTCRSNFLSAFRQLNCGRLSDEDKSNYRRDCEVQVLTMVV
jgi:hypothetical protein